MRRSPAPLTLLVLAAAMAAPGPADAQVRRRPGPARPPTPSAPSSPAAPTASTEPATTPEAAAATEPKSAPPAPSDDVDALRQEYLKLRDQLFRSRARAAAVASALYSSKLRILLDYGSARFYTVTRATVRLDGASVYDDAQGAIAADRAPRWEGFVAPGRHMVTVRIEATGKDDRRFATALESSFTVQAPAGKDLLVRCAARDDGDIAYQWQRSEKGAYRLRLDVGVESVRREERQGGVKRVHR
jgi:hypothetical protein